MSPYVILSVMLVGLVISLWAGMKKDINVGLPTFALAFLGFVFLYGGKSSNLIKSLPVTVMYTLIATSIFFGFAAENGTIEKLAERVMYALRGFGGWFVPFSCLIVSIVVSGLGGGLFGHLAFVCPIYWQIRKKSEFSGLLVVAAAACGGNIGAGFSWAEFGALRNSFVVNFFSPEVAERISNWGNIIYPLAFFGMFVILYFIYGGYKAKKVVVDKPTPMNELQKKNMTLILIVSALLIIPGLLNMIAPNDVTRWLTSRFDIYTLTSIGAVVAWIMKLGDTNNVIRKKVPWDMVYMVAGVNVVMAVCSEVGLAQMMASLLSNSMPLWLISGIMALASCVISYFAGFAVVYPLLLPIIAALGAGGINIGPMLVACFSGCNFTSMSPFSSGGALCLSSCDDPAMRKRQLTTQFIMVLVITVIDTVWCLLPCADFGFHFFM